MHRTLLLCFIHGFKGDDDTFGGFPQRLQTVLGHALPNITIRAVTYPKFETRGDLLECVSRFREWLQNQVIDIEVDAGTPSPTIDPSVHVVLIGHSMGGIVAAETLLSIVSDEPIKSPSASTVGEPLPSTTTNINSTSTSSPPLNNDNTTDTEAGASEQVTAGTSTPGFLFPYITGILAFDTPYLGISPGVLAYGAEAQYKNASSAYSAISSAASHFGWGSSSGAASSGAASTSARSLLPGTGSAQEALNASADAAAAPAWQKWGRYAMFAGAAGAVVAGGAAAYWNKDSMKEGWGWVGSHLEFVGCLMRGEELKTRVGKVVDLSKSRGIGFADLVTVLGKGAGKTEGISVAGGWVEVGGSKGSEQAGGRTFCALPKREEWKPYFDDCINDKVAGEIDAHMSMFFPKDNPGYYELTDKAKEKVVSWIDKAWYEGSEPSKSPPKEESLGTEDEPVIVD